MFTNSDPKRNRMLLPASDLLTRIPEEHSGVNTSFLLAGSFSVMQLFYFLVAILHVGSSCSAFNIHYEEMMMGACNYVHYGGGKQWFVVPSSHRTEVEAVLNGFVTQFYTTKSSY